ncbi:MAG: hypothetical protein KG029_07165 [Bacteroidetes bacterium]|nr:hypothetical protein [Bacteroidota bacterium]
MKAILTVLILALLTSCNMKRYCSKRFPPDVIRKDSISYIEKIVLKDTLIYVPIPFEAKRDTNYVDSFGCASSTLETSFAKSTAVYRDGELIHDLIQKDSLVPALIKGGIMEKYTESFAGTLEKSVIIKNELTGWQNAQIYSAWILAIILLFSALWRKLPSALVSKVMLVFKKKKPP